MTNTEFQIIVGSLLGDGSIAWLKNRKNAYFCEGHSPKQLDYLQWKYDKLSNYVTGCGVKHKRNYNKKTNKDYGAVAMITKQLPIFSDFKNKWYRDRKIVCKEDVEKLDALGLAVWFMDDGTCNENGRRRLISTLGFSEEENNYLVDFLKRKFNLDCYLTYSPGYKFGWQIVFTGDSNRRLVEIIKPYIHKIFNYKIDKVSEKEYKIDQKNIENIRKDYLNKETIKSISKKYNILYCTTQDICSNKIYFDVDYEKNTYKEKEIDQKIIDLYKEGLSGKHIGRKLKIDPKYSLKIIRNIKNGIIKIN